METTENQLSNIYSQTEVELFETIIIDLNDFIAEYRCIISDLDIDVIISVNRLRKYLHFVMICNDSESHKFNSDVINDCITIYHHLIQLLAFKQLPYYEEVISKLRTHLTPLKRIQSQPNHLFD